MFKRVRPMANGRAAKYAKNVLFFAALAAVLVSAFVYTGLRILGYEFYEITSTSMSGTIDKGGVVAVRSVVPKDVEDGDIVAFKKPGFSYPVIHRVIAVSHLEPDVRTVVRKPSGELISDSWKYGHRDFQTKGDANPVADGDLVPQERLIGRMAFEVPPPLNLIVTHLSKQTLFVIGSFALVMYIVAEMLDAARAARNRRRPSPTPELESPV